MTDVAELRHSKRRAGEARRQLLPKKTITKAKAKAKPIPKKKKKKRRIVRISRTGLVQPSHICLRTGLVQAWRQGLKFKKFQRQTQRGDVAKAAATAKTMGEYLKVTPPLSAEATQEGVTQEGYEEYEAAVLFSEDEEEGIENEGHEEDEEVEVDWGAD
mgnify:CR=1 FL=1